MTMNWSDAEIVSTFYKFFKKYQEEKNVVFN
jgi:hypothetical protein